MSKDEHDTLDLVELSNTHNVLTYVPGNQVTAFYLLASDDVPDTSHPVSQQSEHRHEQGQDHSAVLGVAVQLLQQAQQTQQTNGLQQVHQRGLREGSKKMQAGSFWITFTCCFTFINQSLG